MYITSATSLSTQKPCANPIGQYVMWRLSSFSSKPSQCPNVGEPRRRSTTTSKIAPRAQRTSFAAPAPIWKCMPRRTPREEREWLSCTISSVTPSSENSLRR